MCFFTLKTSKKKNRYELKKIFGFGLIMRLGVVYCVFLGHGLVKQGSKGVF
jgi:hypothetical protein